MPSYHAQASFFAAAFVCGDGFGSAPAWLGGSVCRTAAAQPGPAYALAGFIGYSRLVLQMHTPAQVAAGAGVGYALASALVRVAAAFLGCG